MRKVLIAIRGHRFGTTITSGATICEIKSGRVRAPFPEPLFHRPGPGPGFRPTDTHESATYAEECFSCTAP